MLHNWLTDALVFLVLATGICATHGAAADEPPATAPPAPAEAKPSEAEAAAAAEIARSKAIMDEMKQSEARREERHRDHTGRDNAVMGMDRNLAWTGAYGFGDRFGRSGQQVLTRVEGGAYWMKTRYGNRAGMVGGAEMGFDGLAQQVVPPTPDQDGAMSHVLFDFWFGFPVTILEFGEDEDRWFTTAIEPGAGISDKHAYAYVKGRLGIRPTDRLTLEGTWQWTPYNASGILGSWALPGAGLDLATLRVSAYFKLDRNKSLVLTFDWRQSTLDTPQAAVSGDAIKVFSQSPYNSNAFSHLDQIRVDNNFRVGAGLAW